MVGTKLEIRLKKLKAADVMSQFAITVKENETLTSLVHLMMRFKISGIPVLSERSDVCGIVTGGDVLRLMKEMVAGLEKGEGLEHYEALKARDLMDAEVVTITEDTTLYEILKIMCVRNIHTLPIVVMENQHVTGIIGRREILAAFYAEVSAEGKIFT